MEGRFVLATNDLSLSPEELLAQYKNQNVVERGFWFLKDPTSASSDVFLKNVGRIEALGMLMVLMLAAYSFGEYQFRKRLAEHGATVPEICAAGTAEKAHCSPHPRVVQKVARKVLKHERSLPKIWFYKHRSSRGVHPRDTPSGRADRYVTNTFSYGSEKTERRLRFLSLLAT